MRSILTNSSFYVFFSRFSGPYPNIGFSAKKFNPFIHNFILPVPALKYCLSEGSDVIMILKSFFKVLIFVFIALVENFDITDIKIKVHIKIDSGVGRLGFNDKTLLKNEIE